MQLEDLLLDGVGAYKPDHSNVPLLPYSMGTVCSLILDGRVPPRVHQDDVIGGSKVETQSSSLEANKEELAIATLELIDKSLTLIHGCLTVKIEIVDSRILHHLSHLSKEACELAEDKDLIVLPAAKRRDDVPQRRYLRRFSLPLRIDERYGVGQKPQSCQFLEEADVQRLGKFLLLCCLMLLELDLDILADLLLDLQLFRGQFDHLLVADLFRKVIQNLVLGSSEDERHGPVL